MSLRTLNPPVGDGESRSTAAGGGGGVVGVSVPTADLTSSPTALAYLAGSVTAGGDVSVISHVESSNTSWVTNGSGGVIAVGVVNASVTVNAKSTALIGSLVTPGAAISGDSQRRAGRGCRCAASPPAATSRCSPSSNHLSTDHASSSGGGLVGGYTAGATTTVTDRTAAATGAGAQIAGDTVRVIAHSGGAHFLYTHAVMGALFGGTNIFPLLHAQLQRRRACSTASRRAAARSPAATASTCGPGTTPLDADLDDHARPATASARR